MEGEETHIPMVSKMNRVAMIHSGLFAGRARFDMCGHRRCLCLERFWEFANHRLRRGASQKQLFTRRIDGDGISPRASRVSTNDAMFEWTPLLEVSEFVRYKNRADNQ